MATQPVQARDSPGGRLAYERCERPPRSDAEDDEGLQGIYRLSVMRPIRCERVTHLALQLTEDGPPVDHAGEVPLFRTDTCLIEILPDATSQHVLEVGVPVDRLLRQSRWRQTRGGAAEDLCRFAADEIGDAKRLGARVEAPQRPLVRCGRLMERSKCRARLRRSGCDSGSVAPERDVATTFDMWPGVDQLGRRYGALSEMLCETEPAGQRVSRTHKVRETCDAGDYRRGSKVHQDVRPLTNDLGFVERQSEPAGKGRGKGLLH